MPSLMQNVRMTLYFFWVKDTTYSVIVFDILVLKFELKFKLEYILYPYYDKLRNVDLSIPYVHT